MSGALLGALALVLVTGTAFAAATALRIPSWSRLLLAAYVIGVAEIVLLTLFLSIFDGVRRGWIVVGVVALLASAVAGWRAVGAPRPPPVGGLRARGALWSPTLLALAVAIALVLAYVVALLVGTPPSSFDSLTYHLARAAFWSQDDAVGTIADAYDERLNAHPANAEIVLTFLLEVGRNERLAGLAQLAAALALAVGIFALARKLGLRPREAAFGALLFLTLPIVVLQASTTQNDLVAASFLLSASVFLLGETRRELVLAALATALAVGTKVPAAYGVPVLLVIAVVGRGEVRRRERVLAVLAGTALGSYWYVANLVRTGNPLGALTETSDAASVFEPVQNFFAAYARLLDAFDVSGAIDADAYVYALVALVVGIALLVTTRARWFDRASRGLLAALLIVGTPLGVVILSYPLWRVFAKLHDVAGEPDRRLPVAGWQAQTSAGESISWFGPLGLVLVVGVGVVAVVLYRRRALPALGLVFAAAPLAWFVLLALTIAYDPWQGRFFVFPVALSAALWGLVLRAQPIAVAAVAIGATTAALSLVHYEEKPSGLALLERDAPWSVWRMERWDVHVVLRHELRSTLRFVEEKVPSDTTIALALGDDDFGYPAFGRDLERKVVLVPRGSGARDVEAEWLLASPRRVGSIDRACWRSAHRGGGGWRVLARTTCPG